MLKRLIFNPILMVRVILCLCIMSDARALTGEQLIRAAYIYNFALYTEWPEDKLQESKYAVRVCTISNDNLGDAIDSIRKKTIHNIPVQLLRNVSVESASDCHVIYVSEVATETMVKLNKVAIQHHILLITEHSPNIPLKGMITLQVENNRLVFDVDYTYAKMANLNFSSRLLSLAREVH